jgi:predicted transcriptional regulator
MHTIADYMTSQPWSVNIDDSIGVVRQMLAFREIRHLPVIDRGTLVGMITEQGLAGVREREATAERAMTSAVAIDANTPFGDALQMMVDGKHDALVIMRDGDVAGIFTSMDAVRVLCERTRARGHAA